MDGWMEFRVFERAEDLRQEAQRARLARDLRAVRGGGFPSPYRRLLGWLAHPGKYWLEVRSSRKPSSRCC